LSFIKDCEYFTLLFYRRSCFKYRFFKFYTLAVVIFITSNNGFYARDDAPEKGADTRLNQNECCISIPKVFHLFVPPGSAASRRCCPDPVRTFQIYQRALWVSSTRFLRHSCDPFPNSV